MKFNKKKKILLDFKIKLYTWVSDELMVNEWNRWFECILFSVKVEEILPGTCNNTVVI